MFSAGGVGNVGFFQKLFLESREGKSHFSFLDIIRFMTATPVVSIIVPVYNTEKFLHRCIDSILAQTYTDFELLLIDDGSKDSSGTICDEYATQDARVRVFHKENGGVSSARNLGLDNARGEWITFVDSDDWISKDYLEEMMTHSDSDLVIADFTVEGEGQWNEDLPVGKWQGNDLNKIIESRIGIARITAPWCKLLKKSLIGQIRFYTELTTQEDALFMFRYLCVVQNIQIIAQKGYHYNRETIGSLSKSLEGNHIQFYDYLRLLEPIISGIENRFEISRQKLIQYIMGGVMQKEKWYMINEKMGIRQIYEDLKKQRKQLLLQEFFRPKANAKRFNIFSTLFQHKCLCLLTIYVCVLTHFNREYF